MDKLLGTCLFPFYQKRGEVGGGTPSLPSSRCGDSMYQQMLKAQPVLGKEALKGTTYPGSLLSQTGKQQVGGPAPGKWGCCNHPVRLHRAGARLQHHTLKKRLGLSDQPPGQGLLGGLDTLLSGRAWAQG